MDKEILIPEGYEAKIDGNKVILESSDEKIRKSIIKLIQLGGYMSPADKTEAIAYLEKQKEQNLSHIEDVDYEENLDLAKNAIGMMRDGACYLNNRSRNEVLNWLKNVPKIIKQLTIRIGELEKQKEQKPESCDCSRDEESYTNGIHHVLMNPEAYGLIKQKHAEQLGGTFTSYDIAKTFTEGQNYVIAHPEKFGLCKPAEWSEEDEEMLRLCENRIMGTGTFVPTGTGLYNMVSWLKSLRDNYKKCNSHWKPSKEQMNALKIACTIREGERNYYLHTLLDDLEKL